MNLSQTDVGNLRDLPLGHPMFLSMVYEKSATDFEPDREICSCFANDRLNTCNRGVLIWACLNAAVC
jgi:hypothetical protein